MSKGGSSSNQSTTNTTTINNITDLEPLGEVLAQSQDEFGQTLSNALEDSQKIALEAQKIEFINAQMEREQEQQKIDKFDKYIENGRNGLILVSIVGGVLYFNKKGKK